MKGCCWLSYGVVVVLAAAGVALAAEQTTTVRFRLLDESSGPTTPAMVCITGKAQGEVRLPPNGAICTQPSRTETFYRGVNYSSDHNWIGPVRKTLGRTDKNDDRAFVYELRPSLPYWNEPVMYQTSGDFTIDLPAGRWRVAVERGMEYVPVVEEFDLDGSAKTLTRDIALKRWINLAQRGWWSGDVHVHHPTLKPEHIEYLLQYAIASDLHVINLLEMGHHKGTDFKQAYFGSKSRANRGDHWLVSGQEEPRSTFGHIIGLNTQSLVRVEDMADYDYYDIVFRRIHDQPGALVGFAHLAWNGCNLPRGFPWYVTTGQIDFVEMLQMSFLNNMDYYDYLNLGFRLTAAAGSDVPWGSTIGEVRTYVYTGPKLDLDGWFAGLKKGRSFVSNGPAIEFTVDGELPGSELTRSAHSKVRAVAKVWGHPKVGLPRALTIVDNEGVVKEVLNDQQRSELSVEVDVPIEQSRWLVASAVCDNNALAHTTPVYVVVDGRPTWCPKRGPLVIQKQLDAIETIAHEFPRDSGPHAEQIHQRLDKAKAFYADLRRKMVSVP